MQHLNNFQPVPQPVVSPPETHADDTGHPRRSAYAAMRDLQEQFSIAGIETDQVWEHLKDRYSVNSRSLFSGLQWATVAAELQACRRDDCMFKAFVSSIPDEFFRIHVYADDPSVAIGRPRKINHHHNASEWGDFQEIANANQCNLTVSQGQRTTYYDAKPTTEVPAPVSTVESPKMPSEQHQNHRFLTGIQATLKISGKWLPAPEVFTRFYDKYNLVNVHDIEIGLDILAKADEIQSKVVDGEKQYHLPTSDFERLLDRCQMSRYHLAEIAGIDEAVICGYCKGAKISAADAKTIADTLNIERSELEGMCDPPAQPAQKPAIADTNARGEILNIFGDVVEVRA